MPPSPAQRWVAITPLTIETSRSGHGRRYQSSGRRHGHRLVPLGSDAILIWPPLPASVPARSVPACLLRKAIRLTISILALRCASVACRSEACYGPAIAAVMSRWLRSGETEIVAANTENRSTASRAVHTSDARTLIGPAVETIVAGRSDSCCRPRTT